MRVFTFLALILFSTNVLAETHKFYKINYIVEPKDSLAKIFKRFVKPTSIINKSTPMTQKTFKANPHVQSWKDLIPGTSLKIYIGEEFWDQGKYEIYQTESKIALENLKTSHETENAKGEFLVQGLKASMFYMASQGTFSQTSPDGISVKFNQTSPVTLGTSLSFYPKNTNWSYQASAYYSNLKASSSNLDNGNVSVPPEIGASTYAEYRFIDQNFTSYFGLDAEKFSTFNMGNINTERKLIFDRVTTIYATIGASKLIEVFNSPIFTKLSFSKSVSSSIETTSEGADYEKSYQGYKVLLYINKKISKKLYLHSLLKYHNMTGPTELTVYRIGIGFGYILF